MWKGIATTIHEWVQILTCEWPNCSSFSSKLGNNGQILNYSQYNVLELHVRHQGPHLPWFTIRHYCESCALDQSRACLCKRVTAHMYTYPMLPPIKHLQDCPYTTILSICIVPFIALISFDSLDMMHFHQFSCPLPSLSLFLCHLLFTCGH